MRSWRTLLVALLSLVPAVIPASDDCPRYVLCKTDSNGLGDQLEHYVFCVYIAVLMDANGVITDGFTGSGHRGGEEYHTIAGALGVDLNLTQASARARHAPNVTWGTVDHLDLVNAMARSEAARRGESLHPCYAWIVTDVRGCHHEHGDWCDDQYGSFLNFLGSYGWLRNNRVKEECFERKLGFSDRGPAGDTVHIAWHVRNGDRCLHCEDISYFKKVYAHLLAVPSIRRSNHLAFDSPGPVGGLDPSNFPQAAMFEALHSTQSLLSTVCRFATADVLVASGSSLPPFVAAFLPPLSPLVVEERRKEAATVNDTRFFHHFFRPHEALLIEDGDLVNMDEGEFAQWAESVLSDRLALEGRAREQERQCGGAAAAAAAAG